MVIEGLSNFGQSTVLSNIETDTVESQRQESQFFDAIRVDLELERKSRSLRKKLTVKVAKEFIIGDESNLKEAIVGVIGTLLGTILGWILGRIDFGRLQVSFDNTTYEFNTIEDINYIRGNKSNTKYSYSLSTTIQVFNSSNANQVIRNVQIVFNDGKEDLLLVDAKDDNSRKIVAQSARYNNMEIANIQAHTGMDLKVHIYVEKAEQIFKAKKIFVQYKDQHLKLKRLLLKNVDYSKHLRIAEEGKGNV